MPERVYMFCIGVSLVVALYFELPWLGYALIGLMLFVGTTGLYPVSAFRPATMSETSTAPAEPGRRARFDFPAYRAWHLVMACVLLASYVLFYDKLWVLAWFVGFAVTGAGLSGVCPVLMLLRAIGFQ